MVKTVVLEANGNYRMETTYLVIAWEKFYNEGRYVTDGLISTASFRETNELETEFTVAIIIKHTCI